jgi:hypothetical protein
MRGIARRTFPAGTGALCLGVRTVRAQSERVIPVGMILPISGNLAQYVANMFPPFRDLVDKISRD